MLPNTQVERSACKVLRTRPPQHAVTFDPEPETVCYRGQALAIVRNYFEMSCQLGRLPSILGREFFRAKVSHHTIPSFEDQALFRHDIEQSLRKLDDSEMDALTLIGLYDQTVDEAAKLLRCSAGYASERFSQALAHLTQIFLDNGMLRRDRPDRHQSQMKGRKLPASAVPANKPCNTVAGISKHPHRKVQCVG